MAGSSRALFSFLLISTSLCDLAPHLPSYSIAGRDGSVFPLTYDPILAEPVASIIPLSFWKNDSVFTEWTQPVTNKRFKVAKGQDIFTLPSASITETQQTFNSVDDYKQWGYHTRWCSFSFFGIHIGGAHADAFARANLKLLGNTMVSSRFIATSHQLALPDIASLRTAFATGELSATPFARAVRALPRTMEDPFAAFRLRMFLDQYGVAIPVRTAFGGMLEVSGSMSAIFAAAYQVDFSVSMEYAIETAFFLAGLASASADAWGKVSAAFKEQLSIVISSYGGNPLLAFSGNLTSWFASVPSAAAPVFVDFRNISDLVADPDQRALLESAIHDYLSTEDLNQTRAADSCLSPPGLNLTSGDLSHMSQSNDVDARAQLEVGLQTLPQQIMAARAGMGYDVKYGVPLSPLYAENATDNVTWVYPPSGLSVPLRNGFRVIFTPSVCVRGDATLFATASAYADFAARISGGLFALGLKGLILGPAAAFIDEATKGALLLQGGTMVQISLSARFEAFKLLWDGFGAQPSPEFAAAQQHLRDTPPSLARAAADDLVRQFGTHYARSTPFGGACNFTVMVNVSASGGMTMEQRYDYAIFSLSLLLDLLGGKFHMSAAIKKARAAVSKLPLDWDNYAHSSFSCVGGDPTLLGTADSPQKDSFHTWLGSLAQSPAELSAYATLAPISRLFDNSTEQDLVFDAIADRLNATLPQRPMTRNTKPVPAPNMTMPQPASSSQPSSTADAPLIPSQVVPGVCSGHGGVGVGCGYDSAQMDMYGMTVEPLRPVLSLQECPLKCFLDPTQPMCERCVYTDPNTGESYRVPQGLIVTEMPSRSGTYKNFTSRTSDEYQHSVSHTTSHHGWFHSSSTTTTEFNYMEFGMNYSMNLDYQYFTSHSVQLDVGGVDLMSGLTDDFQSAVSQLPADMSSDASKAQYLEFVHSFGTDVMVSATMGALALQSSFFHSCFLDTFSGSCVSHTSKSSFIGIIHSGHADASCIDLTNDKYSQYWQTQFKLAGGEVPKFGALGLHENISAAEFEAWVDSAVGVRLIPILFDLEPITSFIRDPVIADNVNTTLVAHFGAVGASNAQLAAYLTPKDNYKTPSWCVWKPPAA